MFDEDEGIGALVIGIVLFYHHLYCQSFLFALGFGRKNFKHNTAYVWSNRHL